MLLACGLTGKFFAAGKKNVSHARFSYLLRKVFPLLEIFALAAASRTPQAPQSRRDERGRGRTPRQDAEALVRPPPMATTWILALPGAGSTAANDNVCCDWS